MSGTVVLLSMDSLVIQGRIDDAPRQWVIPNRCLTRVEESVGGQPFMAALGRALAQGVAIASAVLVWAHSGTSPDRIAPARVVLPAGLTLGAATGIVFFGFRERDIWREIPLAAIRPAPVLGERCSVRTR